MVTSSTAKATLQFGAEAPHHNLSSELRWALTLSYYASADEHGYFQSGGRRRYPIPVSVKTYCGWLESASIFCLSCRT
jgi:hypothetical protein